MVSSSRGESVWHVSVLSNGFLKLPWLESSSAYTCRCHQLPGPSSAEAGAAERKRNGSRNEQGLKIILPSLPTVGRTPKQSNPTGRRRRPQINLRKSTTLGAQLQNFWQTLGGRRNQKIKNIKQWKCYLANVG